MIVSFSGGRTSAYMAWKLKQLGHDITCVFMNTGEEDDRTLDFVDECDRRWGLGIIWLEAVVHFDERVGSTHSVVSYQKCSRSGEPFDDVVRKYGIPNKSHPHCNRELKLNPFNSWKRLNAPNDKIAIGIRVDEMDRQAANAKENNLIYPMISMFPTTKGDVLAWWDKQDFNLGVPEHYGNCVTCWKKSDRKLKTLALENPALFDRFAAMEVKYADSNAENNCGKFFRGKKSTGDLIASSFDTFAVFRDRLFPQESDLPNGCGETCDLFAEYPQTASMPHTKGFGPTTQGIQMNIDSIARHTGVSASDLLVKIITLDKQYGLGIDDHDALTRKQYNVIRASVDQDYMVGLITGVKDRKYNYQNSPSYPEVLHAASTMDLNGFSTTDVIDSLPHDVIPRGVQVVAAAMREAGYESKVIKLDNNKQGRRWHKPVSFF